MSLSQRTIQIIRHQGFWTIVLKLYAIIEDKVFDIKHGINTCKECDLSELTIDSDNKKRAIRYEPTRLMPLRQMFQFIQPYIPADSIFVDMGCGKGRVLLVASEFGFLDVRGVEFAQELCQIAEMNHAVYKNKKGFRTKCRISNCDVVDYAISADENVFYMFNPFDETILINVLNNIAASLKTKNRKILIIYRNAKYGHVIEQQSQFTRLRELDFMGHDFTVYTNQNYP